MTDASVDAELRGPVAASRLPYLDNLKVALVAGVIIAHVTMAWTDLPNTWVLSEPPVREPLLSLLRLAAVIGVLFGMPLFFMVAGWFTPASLRRKGPRRFAIDRTVRLLVPIVLFVLLLTPPIEFVDTSNAGWSRGFWAFVPHAWWPFPPSPGPTWFLGVLLVFSLSYAVFRTIWPGHATDRPPLRARHLVAAAGTVAVASYLLRLVVPMGEERWHVALAQAPAWTVGFVLGLVAGEHGGLPPLAPAVARSVRRAAWTAIAVTASLVAIVATGIGEDVLFGNGTWQSLVFAVLEGAVMVTMSLWLIDLFRRRVNYRGRLARALWRAAYAAFLVHQVVLVAVVLASRHLPWPPELRYITVGALGVAASFGVGALLLRLPGVSRVL
ncbi:MAG: acyltransferase family protein [Micromonosporaceae bacterium]